MMSSGIIKHIYYIYINTVLIICRQDKTFTGKDVPSKYDIEA